MSIKNRKHFGINLYAISNKIICKKRFANFFRSCKLLYKTDFISTLFKNLQKLKIYNEKWTKRRISYSFIFKHYIEILILITQNVITLCYMMNVMKHFGINFQLKNISCDNP